MKLLYDLYRISSPSGDEFKMIAFLTSKMEELGAEVYEDRFGNLYATKGISETYPCIVAHMDEVHINKKNGFRVSCVSDMIFGVNTQLKRFSGIGADDKNGIWVALKLLEQFDAIKVAFFVCEEIGCEGSRDCNMNFFDDCRFVLQCDRKGNSDLISNACSTELCSEEFLADIDMDSYGYSEAKGSMTDVYQLKMNGLPVSCCNISVGYYNPHMDEEYTVKEDLYNCLAFTENIVRNCIDVYPHEYKAPVWDSKYGSNYYGSYDYHHGNKWPNKPVYIDITEKVDVRDKTVFVEVDEMYDIAYNQYNDLIDYIIEKSLTFMSPSDLYNKYKYKFPDLEYDDFEAALDESIESSDNDYSFFKRGK